MYYSDGKCEKSISDALVVLPLVSLQDAQKRHFITELPNLYRLIPSRFVLVARLHLVRSPEKAPGIPADVCTCHINCFLLHRPRQPPGSSIPELYVMRYL